MKTLLLLAILFLTQSVFAVVPLAGQVRAKADKYNKVNESLQLPTLLHEVEDSIDLMSSLGFYSTSVNISQYSEHTILKAGNLLVQKGYIVVYVTSPHEPNRKPYMEVRWK